MPLLRWLFGKKDKSCLTLFSGVDDVIVVTLVDGERENNIFVESFDCRNGFIKNIPKNFGNKLKAVFLELEGFHGHNHKSNVDLCHAFRAKLSSLDIPHYFISNHSYSLSSIIIGSNITNLNFGDTIVCGGGNQTTIFFTEMEYTENGYLENECDRTEFDVDENDKNAVLTKKDIDEVCKKAADYCKLHKFVIFQNNTETPFTQFLKNQLKFKNLIFADVDDAKFLVEATKWLFDKSYTKFHVIPFRTDECLIMNSAADVFISIDEYDILPITKSCIIPNSVTAVLQCELETEKAKNCVHYTNKNCHRNKITVSVDAENFMKFRAEPILLPQIKLLPGYLNDAVKSKIPVIGFCDDFSVICVYKDEENGYKFMDEWNGIYGKELVINFCNPNPLYCEQALAASKSTVSYDFNEDGNIFKIQEPKKPIFGYNKKNPYSASNEKDQYKPDSLVYDLLLIMSMPVDNIMLEDSWGFRITKNEKNPVLLEFKNHEKILKQASPAFLMALLLKHHIKTIQKKMEQKPEKLGFCILDEAYCSEEIERIKNGIEEACEMLKIEFEFF